MTGFHSWGLQDGRNPQPSGAQASCCQQNTAAGHQPTDKVQTCYTTAAVAYALQQLENHPIGKRRTIQHLAFVLCCW